MPRCRHLYTDDVWRIPATAERIVCLNPLTPMLISRESSHELEQRIDERRNGGSLSQDYQATQQGEHHDNRQEPEFLPLLHKGPQLSEKLPLPISVSLKLPGHMGMRPRLPHDPIARSISAQRSAHRIPTKHPHHDPHRRDQSKV